MLNPFLPPQTFKGHHKNMRRHNFINQLSNIEVKGIKGDKKTMPNGDRKYSCQKGILWTPGGKKKHQTFSVFGISHSLFLDEM